MTGNDKLYQLVFQDDQKFLKTKERNGKMIFTHQVKNFGPGLVTTVDPSRADHDWPRDKTNAIGSVSGTLLITTQSGGDSETLGWTYNSNQFWTTEPKTYVNFENFADWELVDF